MIEQCEAIDRWLVTVINGWHNPVLDEVMWIISAKLTWIPFYLLILYLFFRTSNWKGTLLFLVVAVVVVALTDQISNQLFKDWIARYRPSHHALLTDRLHFYRLSNGEFYKGGQFGFVSSHAANFFGICTFAWLVLRSHYKHLFYLLLSVAILVSMSRVYLGVHYLSDVFFGGLLGIGIAILVYRILYLRIIPTTAE